MKDQSKTKQALIKELAALRQKIVELESMKSGPAPIDHRQRQHVEEPEKGPSASSKIQVSGINVAWDAVRGTCTFEDLPVVMMWVDATLAGLMSGVQAMVGTERFFLALQGEGRKSVEADWQVISQYPDFRDGFTAIANIAAVAGWGYWELASLDTERRECHFRIRDSWEGRYQRSLGVCWGSGMLAGKMAGYCTKLFGTNCWADQTHFIAKGDNCDEFFVQPSPRSIENEIEDLLVSGEATRADMAVALKKLEKEIAERKHAENALRTANKQLQDIIEFLPDATIIADKDNKVIAWNRAMEELTGVSKAAIIGQDHHQATIPFYGEVRPSLMDLVCVDDKELADKYSAVRRIGAVVHAEAFTPALYNNRGAHVFAVASPLFDEANNVVGIIESIRDITERKHAEDALRESEKKYREFADLLPQIVFETNIQGTITFVNRSALAMSGYTQEDVEKGVNMLDTIIPEDREQARESLKQLLASGISLGNEYTFLRKDGGTFPVIIHTSTVIRDGHVVGLRGFAVDITDRRRTEEALRKSEERFRNIFENATEGIYQTTPEGRYLNVNPAFARMFGYSSPQEMIDSVSNIGQQLYVNPKDREEMVRKLREHGRVEGYEVQVYRKDRSKFWISINIHTVRDEAGSIKYFEGTNQDITERRQTEEALRESEGKFKDLAEKSMVGIYLYQDGVFKYINGGLAEIFGYAPEEIIDRLGLKDVIHPADLQMVQENVRQRLSGEKQSKRYEFRAITKNGDVKRVEVYGSQTLYLGKPAVVGTVLDVTERRKAEKELLESEEKYRQLVENASEAIFVAQNYKLVFVNAATAKLTRYTVSELMTRPFVDFIHPEDRDMIAERHLSRLKGEEIPHAYSFRIIRKDGQIRWGELHAILIHWGGEQATLNFLTDITERKYLESQLAQSQKMEAIGTLAGGIAHDFNNILTALIGYGNILQMKMKEDDPSWVYVEQILASSEKAANLTQSLLAFSRKQAVELKPQTVNTIIGGIEKLLKRLLTEDITLTIILPDNDLTIMADITQIDQVLMNLATNARDAMPRGGTLTIEVKESTIDNAFIIGEDYGRPGAYALISVTDTGIGMDKQTQERIFDPFFTTKEVGKGTGLGLSTVYGIIKQHNGSIHVESEPGRGSAFRIYLPVVPISVQHKKAAPLPVEGGTETILLAEDNSAVRELTKEVLTLSGYTVIEAVDGEDAIRKFLEHKDTIGLMLADVVMPKKNGKEVYEEIIKVMPNAKVIFMSGYTGDVVLEKGVFEDTIDFIKKPLVPDELLLKIRTVLNR